MKYMQQAKRFGAKVAAPVAGVGTALASAAAMAQSTSAGGAIAGELSTGKSEVLLVVGAVAIILGVIILWRYVKKAG
jgi:hypothetical protein